MPLQSAGTLSLSHQLEQWIEQRTGGRIRGLWIEESGRHMVVHGHTGSHYHRQLALAAVLETLENCKERRVPTVELDIQVVARPRTRISQPFVAH